MTYLVEAYRLDMEYPVVDLGSRGTFETAQLACKKYAGTSLTWELLVSWAWEAWGDGLLVPDRRLAGANREKSRGFAEWTGTVNLL